MNGAATSFHLLNSQYTYSTLNLPPNNTSNKKQTIKEVLNSWLLKVWVLIFQKYILQRDSANFSKPKKTYAVFLKTSYLLINFIILLSLTIFSLSRKLLKQHIVASNTIFLHLNVLCAWRDTVHHKQTKDCAIKTNPSSIRDINIIKKKKSLHLWYYLPPLLYFVYIEIFDLLQI